MKMKTLYTIRTVLSVITLFAIAFLLWVIFTIGKLMYEDVTGDSGSSAPHTQEQGNRGSGIPVMDLSEGK